MTTIKRIHHAALVVQDLEAGLKFWRDALGLKLDHIEDVPEQESRVAFLPVGDGEIELVLPTTDDSGIARYLAKRGPGIHHLCLEVDDLPAALEQLRQHGIRLIHEQPVAAAGGRRAAFIHPESTGGVLVELYE
ncbi:MAG: methylmalonyl-CoA epimerase [Anaerolineales bacterium]|nr:methylmalonyl-CoA epimerase [Anaerolineales bacterium]